MAADYGASVGFSERSTDIDTPPSGKANIYLKDKNLYLKNDEDTVTKFALAGDAPTAHADTHESGGTDELELAAAQITTGQMALARGGTGGDLSGSGGSGQYVKQESAGGALSVGTIPATDIPDISTEKLTSGTLDLERGGTGVDLSASGDTNHFLAQDGSHIISARALTTTDIPNLSTDKLTSGTLPIGRGGTNATTAADARTSLDVVQKGASGTDEARVTKLYDSSGNVIATVNVSGGIDVGTPTTSAGANGLAIDGDLRVENGSIYIKSVQSFICEASPATLDFSPLPNDPDGSYLRFFRPTNTSGDVLMDIYPGDNSSAPNHRLSGNSNKGTSVCRLNGVFSIGTSSDGGLGHGDCYVSDELSAATLTDRTPMPNSVADARRAILSMCRNPAYETQMVEYHNTKNAVMARRQATIAASKRKDTDEFGIELEPLPEPPSELDYDALDPLLKSKTGKRNLSATVSALVLLVQEQQKQINSLLELVEKG